MLKKTITYVDFNANVVTEDFYFNLTKAEIAEMELSESKLSSDGNVSGGLMSMLNEVIESGSGKRIIEVFKDILAKAYGVKSEDGKRFMKSPELYEAFTQTAAYSDFFIELLTEENKAADFIKAIMPFDAETQPKTVNPGLNS